MLPDNTAPTDEYARLVSLFSSNNMQPAHLLSGNSMAAAAAPGMVFTNHGIVIAQAPAPRDQHMNTDNLEIMPGQTLDQL